MIRKTNLSDAVTDIRELWSPHVVDELNGQYVKIAKIEGEFVWHKHDDEDEFFLVLKGNMEIHLRDGVVGLGEGDCCTVPRGVEHKPVASDVCHILLFEPVATRNTGDAIDERTVGPDDLRRV